MSRNILTRDKMSQPLEAWRLALEAWSLALEAWSLDPILVARILRNCYFTSDPGPAAHYTLRGILLIPDPTGTLIRINYGMVLDQGSVALLCLYE